MSDARKPKTAPRVVHAAVEFTAAPAVPKRHRTRWILGDPEADAVEQEVEEHVRGRRGKDAKPTAERKAKDVERFELLAKATAKVPTVAPRKLYVDKRDGSIGVITARDLGDKLLEREAIANETADGVRPKEIKCERCGISVLAIGRGSARRRFCKQHLRHKPCPRGCGRDVKLEVACCRKCHTPEERVAMMAHARVASEKARTPQRMAELASKMRERSRTMWDAMSPEERRDYARKAQSGIPRERRSEVMRASWASRTPSQLLEVSERQREAHARRTAAERSDAARRRQNAKTPETRRDEAIRGAATRRAKASAKKAGEQ